MPNKKTRGDFVKIAITCQGPSLDDTIDQRFGRAVYFLIFDSDSHFVTVIDNEAMAPSGGAGIAAAQSLVDQGVTVIITGQIGPNALRVFRAADIRLVQGVAGTAKKNLDLFLDNQLKDLERFVPSH